MSSTRGPKSSASNIAKNADKALKQDDGVTPLRKKPGRKPGVRSKSLGSISESKSKGSKARTGSASSGHLLENVLHQAGLLKEATVRKKPGRKRKTETQPITLGESNEFVVSPVKRRKPGPKKKVPSEIASTSCVQSTSEVYSASTCENQSATILPIARRKPGPKKKVPSEIPSSSFVQSTSEVYSASTFENQSATILPIARRKPGPKKKVPSEIPSSSSVQSTSEVYSASTFENQSATILPIARRKPGPKKKVPSEIPSASSVQSTSEVYSASTCENQNAIILPIARRKPGPKKKVPSEIPSSSCVQSTSEVYSASTRENQNAIILPIARRKPGPKKKVSLEAPSVSENLGLVPNKQIHLTSPITVGRKKTGPKKRILLVAASLAEHSKRGSKKDNVTFSPSLAHRGKHIKVTAKGHKPGLKKTGKLLSVRSVISSKKTKKAVVSERRKPGPKKKHLTTDSIETKTLSIEEKQHPKKTFGQKKKCQFAETVPASASPQCELKPKSSQKLAANSEHFGGSSAIAYQPKKRGRKPKSAVLPIPLHLHPGMNNTVQCPSAEKKSGLAKTSLSENDLNLQKNDCDESECFSLDTSDCKDKFVVKQEQMCGKSDSGISSKPTETRLTPKVSSVDNLEFMSSDFGSKNAVPVSDMVTNYSIADSDTKPDQCPGMASDANIMSVKDSKLLVSGKKREKSLPRELSNLSFSNPGKAIVNVDISLTGQTASSASGKSLRHHPGVKYSDTKRRFRRHTLLKPNEHLSVSRMKLWKEKQASMKRKKSIHPQKSWCFQKKRLLSREQTDSSSNANKSVLESGVPSRDEQDGIITELAIQKTISAVRVLHPITTENLSGKPNTSTLDTPVHDSGVVPCAENYKEGVPGFVAPKRKRGRPPKKSLTSNLLIPSVTSERESNMKLLPATVEQNTCSFPQQSCVVERPHPKVRKKRKRRSYKGCLDESFKSKKTKSVKSVTPSCQEFSADSNNLGSKQFSASGKALTVEEKSVDECIVRNSVSDFSIEDAFHEEHSYAMNSPKISPVFRKKQLSTDIAASNIVLQTDSTFEGISTSAVKNLKHAFDGEVNVLGFSELRSDTSGFEKTSPISFGGDNCESQVVSTEVVCSSETLHVEDLQDVETVPTETDRSVSDAFNSCDDIKVYAETCSSGKPKEQPVKINFVHNPTDISCSGDTSSTCEEDEAVVESETKSLSLQDTDLPFKQIQRTDSTGDSVGATEPLNVNLDCGEKETETSIEKSQDTQKTVLPEACSSVCAVQLDKNNDNRNTISPSTLIQDNSHLSETNSVNIEHLKTDQTPVQQVPTISDSTTKPLGPLKIVVEGLPDSFNSPPPLTPQDPFEYVSPGSACLAVRSPPVLQASATKLAGPQTVILECSESGVSEAHGEILEIEEKPESMEHLDPLEQSSVNCEEVCDSSEISKSAEVQQVSTELITSQSSPSNSDTSIQDLMPYPQNLIFKRPRGRPRKKPKDNTIVEKKPKYKTTEAFCKKSKETKESNQRTFALRPKISRSPLENIALRFGREEAYLSFKKRNRAVFPSSEVPKEETSECLLAQCKPCSVVLTDFVKQLDLSDINSSDESDSDLWDTDSQEETEIPIKHSASPQKTLTPETVDENSFVGSFLQFIQSTRPVASMSSQSARKSVTHTSVSPQKAVLSPGKAARKCDALASGMLELFAHYKCKHCNFTSESSQEIEQHVLTHDNFFSTLPVSCSTCDRRFRDFIGFSQHHSRLHPLAPRKWEKFTQLKESEHYNIVLQDGSSVDVKTSSVQAGFLSFQSPTSKSTSVPPLIPYDSTPIKSLAIKSHGLPVKSSSESTPVVSTSEICMGKAEKESEPKEDEDEVSKEVNKVIQDMLDRLEFGHVLNKETDDAPCYNKVSSAAHLLSTECAEKEDDSVRTNNFPPQDEIAEASSLGISSEGGDASKGSSSSVNVTTDTTSKVNPIVEKLRKIVKSVPQAMNISSRTTTAIDTTPDVRRPSVVLQTEQGGKTASSVLATSSASAPVIISVVVSGNCEVTRSNPTEQLRADIPSQHVPKFICTFCMYGSEDRGRMVEHVALMHSDEAQFACCICDSAFSANTSVIHQHIRTCHPGQDEHKFCKPLPSFYATDELKQHDSLRLKTSDNIFEMFGPAGDHTVTTTQPNEPLRQHFRKARDVMCFREKARRQAEADSTTSCTEEETATTTSPVAQLDRSSTIDEIFPKSPAAPPCLMSEGRMDPEPVSSSNKCSDVSTESTTIEEIQSVEESPQSSVQEAVHTPTKSTQSDSQDETSPMLKIVSVVSLSETDQYDNSEVNIDVENSQPSDSDPAALSPGSISLEAARSAASALFKKKNLGARNVYVDSHCKICFMKCLSMPALFRHLEIVHTRSCDYECPFCEQRLGQNEKLAKEHFEQKHHCFDFPVHIHVSDEDVPAGIRCKHCPVTRPTAGEMLKHLEGVHHENCLLLCPYCKKGVGKEEEDGYEHIRTQHKNYDTFVPLLLVSNNIPFMRKSMVKDVATVSHFTDDKQCQSAKLFSEENLTVSEKLYDVEEDEVSVMESDIEILPSDTPLPVPIAQEPHLECEQPEPPVENNNEPVLSPLAMLKKATNSILDQASSEANTAQQSSSPVTLSGADIDESLISVFNVQPSQNIVQQTTTLLSRSGLTSESATSASPLQQGQLQQTAAFPQPATVPPVPTTQTRSVVPRGIKHVEKRPLKDMRAIYPMGYQRSDLPTTTSSPQAKSASPLISRIAPVEQATAIATTVTRPLLRVPSVIPSTAGKARPGKPLHESNQTGNTSKQPTLPYGWSSPRLVSDPVQTTTVETPLDLSVSTVSREGLDSPTEDDIDPDAFSVFNLAPETAAASGSSTAQPLNLSVSPSPPATIRSPHPNFQSPPHIFQRGLAPRTAIPTLNQLRGPRFDTSHMSQRPLGNVSMSRSGTMIMSGYVPPRLPTPSATRSPTPQMFSRHQGSPLPRMWWSGNPEVRSPFRSPSGEGHSLYSEFQQYNRAICEECGFVTMNPASLKAHVTKVHMARYRCPYCPNVVPLARLDVADHISNLHPGKKVMYFNL